MVLDIWVQNPLSNWFYRFIWSHSHKLANLCFWCQIFPLIFPLQVWGLGGPRYIYFFIEKAATSKLCSTEIKIVATTCTWVISYKYFHRQYKFFTPIYVYFLCPIYVYYVEPLGWSVPKSTPSLWASNFGRHLRKSL